MGWHFQRQAQATQIHLIDHQMVTEKKIVLANQSRRTSQSPWNQMSIPKALVFVLRRAAFRLAFVCLDRISQTVANGRIDKATMAKLLRRVWHVDDRMIGLLIALLDKDNCGTINVHEFTYLFELMLLKVQRVGEKATWFQRHCHMRRKIAS